VKVVLDSIFAEILKYQPDGVLCLQLGVLPHVDCHHRSFKMRTLEGLNMNTSLPIPWKYHASQSGDKVIDSATIYTCKTYVQGVCNNSCGILIHEILAAIGFATSSTCLRARTSRSIVDNATLNNRIPRGVLARHC
jgi:hypothetical protein